MYNHKGGAHKKHIVVATERLNTYKAILRSAKTITTKAYYEIKTKNVGWFYFCKNYCVITLPIAGDYKCQTLLARIVSWARALLVSCTELSASKGGCLFFLQQRLPMKRRENVTNVPMFCVAERIKIGPFKVMPRTAAESLGWQCGQRNPSARGALTDL